jgi:hypothetical protein
MEQLRPLPSGEELELDFRYFGIPDEAAWRLAIPGAAVRVRRGADEYELLPLGAVVAAPSGLFALRNARTGALLAEVAGRVEEADVAAMPVRVWFHPPSGRYALQAVCGPRDTAPPASLRTFLAAGADYVGSAFALPSLHSTQGLWSLSGSSLVSA